MTPRRELVAAASRYTSRRIRAKPVDQSWQERAWAFYDAVPEVRFAATWIANAMSGARLYAGRRNDEGKIEPLPPEHRASQLVASIAGGPDGQAQLLGDFGPQLVIAGEGWVVIRPTVADGMVTGESWHVLSVREVRAQSGKLVAELDGEETDIPGFDPDAAHDPTAPVALRVWEPHPARSREADSPVRSSLTLLEELQLLNAAVAAIARSRLTGRGILLVPKGTRFPGTPVNGEEEDDLIDVLMTVAETAYKEPESAAATVPIILEVPAEAIGQIQRLTFESDFDELALKLRDEAIRRFATGLEVPAEILLGQGDVNHWGAWALQEEAIRLGVAPKLSTVAHGFTSQWLRPLLEAENVEDADRCLVWYDTSPLRVRTNRSETALKVYEAGALSAKALRRETGFEESDAPTASEQRSRELERTEDPDTSRSTDLPADESTSEPHTLPASAGGPLSEGVLAAADGLIWAALSAAGRKLERTPACPRSERARAREIEPARLHTLLPVEAGQVEQWKLLDGAWARVPEVAARYNLDPECLTATLDDYCRELIAAGVPHSFEQTMGALRTPCLALAS